MKFRIGVGRTLVDEHGIMQCQRSGDMWTIEVPDDGTEFLSRIWMMADGLVVLSLPLTLAPTIARYGTPALPEVEDDEDDD